MDEIAFQVQRDEESGFLVAASWGPQWDGPRGSGGITTQGEDLRDLQQQVIEAVSVHFEGEEAPRRIRLHFVNDAILVPA